MSSSGDTQMRLVKGDILKSSAHAIINTVNCVGVMGKGIALAFKREYPAMFEDYVARCERGEVRLGEPYPYYAQDHVIINFPTKQHWRSVSRLVDIEQGLIYLRERLHKWGIESIAVPPLGCGNGQLDWSVVYPTLVRHLSHFDVPVELYVPHDVAVEDAQLSLLDVENIATAPPRVDYAHIALVEILNQLEHGVYHWPVGRIFFQKLAYFATVAGVPTGLEYEPSSFGPFAPGLKKVVAQLQNHGLVREERRGKMFEVVVGPTYVDARELLTSEGLDSWLEPIGRVTDLMARFDTRQAEVAATVHYAATALARRYDRPPSAAEVMAAVAKWKVRRDPPIESGDVGRSIVSLATQGWISVEADESITEFLDELVPF